MYRGSPEREAYTKQAEREAKRGYQLRYESSCHEINKKEEEKRSGTSSGTSSFDRGIANMLNSHTEKPTPQGVQCQAECSDESAVEVNSHIPDQGSLLPVFGVKKRHATEEFKRVSMVIPSFLTLSETPLNYP